MASSNSEIPKEFRFFRVYKDGRVELFEPDCEKIPPSDDPTTGVRSKDVVISSEPPVSARIFIAYEAQNPNQKKLPLLFYVHGGGFCRRSAFGPRYHNFCSAALNWVASHAGGNGPEPWLNDHADFGRVFIGGGSAGGNIAHALAFRVGSIGLPRVKLVGVIMVHPFFGGTSPEEDEMWLYMCPTNGGLQDPRLKPPAEDLTRLGCERVLIFVAEKDFLKPVAMNYYEDLNKSGWKGAVELVETHGEGHSFYFDNLKCEKAVELINKERVPLLSIQCSNPGSDLSLLYHCVKPLRHAVKPPSSVTALSLHHVSPCQAALRCHKSPTRHRAITSQPTTKIDSRASYPPPQYPATAC
ncbi:putative carboxylesterase 5 [Citrus sinensis]|uniref:Carboxylesterase 5 n=1 Tax=Citrus sinensis TaxID=2711 RepID=A0ACB8IFD2_CITSI|nr:putative carboxylesterase 5 [Citrus sinensis]